jgi:hypothetical protein
LCVILLFPIPFPYVSDKQSVDMLVSPFSRPLSCVLTIYPSIYAPKTKTCLERPKTPLELIEEK